NVLTFGGFYSGSPYLGALVSLPPGEGGLNPDAGFAYMWHSHTEREMVNNDVFPGGMMTMLVIEAPGVDIMD
ncbi:MAG: multicopper oxidase family protein, partial [Chloroflexi bacterium]|nr:multicopper oxidase family protein [Chloroflexota bacterium]